jgi:hypothetical protein
MVETDNGELVLRILREIRAEQAQHRTLILQSIDASRRIEQRLDARITALDLHVTGLRDDMELLIKSEIMGRMTNFETKFEHRLDKLEETPA